MEAKKKRGCNYTAAEKDILLDLIKKHKHIIDSKVTKGHMILKKRETWEFVCQQYNAVAVSGFRKWHQLRHLYENIKQRSKKNITQINREIMLENIKKLQKTASNDKNEICCTGGRADKSTMEQDAQILVMVTPKIEPLPKPYDDAALHFGDVEVKKNNKDKASESIIMNTDKTDDQYTTTPNITVTKCSEPCLVKSNTPDERMNGKTAIATEHQEYNEPQPSTSEISGYSTAQSPAKSKLKKRNIKFEYFKTKLRNAKIENNYLINKIKMDRDKHKLEMEILKMNLNKLKSIRKRKH